MAMTIEARNTILRVPFMSEELSYVDGEKWLGIQKDKDSQTGENHETPILYRVLSDEQIAIFPYHYDIKSHEMVRGKPQVLTGKNINKANLHSNGLIFRTYLHWKPTK